jgi:hypothetical protein
MIYTQFSDLKDVFFSKLEARTSWGRNQVMEIFRDACIEVLEARLNEAKKMKEQLTNDMEAPPW